MNKQNENKYLGKELVLTWFEKIINEESAISLLTQTIQTYVVNQIKDQFDVPNDLPEKTIQEINKLAQHLTYKIMEEVSQSIVSSSVTADNETTKWISELVRLKDQYQKNIGKDQ